MAPLHSSVVFLLGAAAPPRRGFSTFYHSSSSCCCCCLLLQGSPGGKRAAGYRERRGNSMGMHHTRTRPRASPGAACLLCGQLRGSYSRYQEHCSSTTNLLPHYYCGAWWADCTVVVVVGRSPSCMRGNQSNARRRLYDRRCAAPLGIQYNI